MRVLLRPQVSAAPFPKRWFRKLMQPQACYEVRAWRLISVFEERLGPPAPAEANAQTQSRHKSCHTPAATAELSLRLKMSASASDKFYICIRCSSLTYANLSASASLSRTYPKTMVSQIHAATRVVCLVQLALG